MAGGGGTGLKRRGLAKTHAKWHSLFRGCVWTQAKWPGAKWLRMFWPLKITEGGLPQHLKDIQSNLDNKLNQRVYQLNATRLNTTWDLTSLGSLLDWFGIQAIRVLYEV